jgi:Flp pilus assembly pilin Flp
MSVRPTVQTEGAVRVRLPTPKGTHMNMITARLFMAYATLVHRIETREERGASMTEYAILVAVMAGVVVVLVKLLGSRISTFINSINITT